MSKSSSEFWNDAYLDTSEMKGKDRDQERDYDCEQEHGCDSRSARALKKIISLLDELNNQDLRLLDEILHRIVCERKH